MSDTPEFKEVILQNPVMDETGKFIEKEEFDKKREREKSKEKKSKLNKKINKTGLKIYEFLQNAKIFYDLQPYFYDKAGIWWVWTRNRWEMTDDVDMERKLDEVLGFNGQSVAASIRNGHLRAMMWYGREKQPKDAPKKWVQFKNKAFSLKSSKVYDVTKDYFFTNPIDWEMGESEETPVMDKLFEEWVGKDNIQTLYEIIAYCCYTDYPIHRIFCLVGAGSNGKSTFLRLLEKFLGDNVCASELDDLVSNRFESFKLYKKLCCMMGETNFGKMNKTSLLKKLCGQDLIGFEKKGKDPFTDRNYAKIVISSNSLPSSDDTSDGWYRRWTILDFGSQFPEGRDILEEVPPKEYQNLCKKVMIMLQNVLKNGGFHNQGTMEKRRDKYLEVSNPLSIFLNLCCVRDEEFYENSSKLYIMYLSFLKNLKKRRVKSIEFKKSLEDEGLWINRTSKKIDDEFKTAFWVEGIKIKDSLCNYADYALFLIRLKEKKEYKSIDVNTANRKHCIIAQNCINDEIIHLPCHICGSTPSHSYDDLAQGKPLCGLCYKYKQSIRKIEEKVEQNE